MAILLWRDLYKSYTGSFGKLFIISHVATILFMFFAMYVGNKFGQFYYRVEYTFQDLMDLYGDSRIVAGIGAWLVVSAFMGLFLSAKQDERDFKARAEQYRLHGEKSRINPKGVEIRHPENALEENNDTES